MSMARKPRHSKGRRMVPNYFVFCEGETEVAYVEALRAHFRKPVHIIVRKADSNITDAYIARSKQEYVQTAGDRAFVLFDLDVPGMLEHLNGLKNVEVICSNPCLEVWFLLHFVDVPQELSSEECLKRLWQVYSDYRKGKGSAAFHKELLARMPEAMRRAEQMRKHENPSTDMDELVKAIGGIKE